MPTPRRTLPVYPSPIPKESSDRRISPEIAKVLRDSEKAYGVTVGDMIPIEMDDHIAFSCGRSGACCQGRHPLSNLVTPREAAFMWKTLQERGVNDIENFVPETLARVIHINAPPPKSVGGGKFTELVPRSLDISPTGVFGGLMFRMLADASMPDGDRCQFLLGDTPGAYACTWHGTRGQPTACALAPVGIMNAEKNPLFAIMRSRYSWCQGSREATDSGKGFTLRELLLRNHGDERLAEARIFAEARDATTGWKRGFRNHHSPLALLYVTAIPELGPVLSGY